MTKLNIRLSQKDEENIKKLKEYYGLTENSELVRYVLTSAVRNLPNYFISGNTVGIRS